MGKANTTTDKASRRATAERDPGPAAGAPAAAAPAQVPAMDMAPLRAAPQGRSLEAMQPEDVYMDALVYKLQLLNFERDFCRRKKPHRKGLNPTYFAAPQPGQAGNEQFFYFTNLAAWLLQLCGLSVATPKEFDDPNATLQGLMQALRSLGFAPPSYPPTKLAAGYGREVCALLDSLADVTLERRGFAASRPVYQQDRADIDEADAADVDEDDAADIATTAGQQAEESDDEGQETALLWGRAADNSPSPTAAAAAAESTAVKQVLVSTVDPMQWRLEVERVGPRLRTNLAAEQRDWRQHLEAAHASTQALAASWPDAKAVLTKLGSEVAASLEKVEGRERQLNGQYDGLMVQYQDTRQELMAAQEEYNRCTELISERNNELHRLASALQDAKQQLDSRGSNLSDTSPLVRLKAAMANLKAELRQMELRIGVVSHQVVSLSLRDKQAALVDAAKQQQRLRDAPGSAK
ncbi:hypothetical protein OEZ85_009284 [Tetradesmus obliquus]|uniref:Intraflagellar transport protein 57 n=1 Tax=Tetradesmus obliquus TaxID=3088 RepID=A0ABY8U8H6_TETOB|nr:hypothetical protein OEZ85_009284 [Tetradesmus obliquus]